MIPPPVGGVNYRDAWVNMQPQDAIVLDNMIPTQSGVEQRPGWQYFSATTNAAIRSVFAYNAGSSSNSKLFAGSAGKIYDVTSGTPSLVVAAGSTNDMWSTAHFSTTAGIFLLAVSPGAGYYTYDPTGGWILRTPAGLPANPTSVAVFKNRVWFTIQNSASLWYLDTVNAITGTAVEFPIGAQLKHGGAAIGLTNWTIDGGIGVDDYFVAFGAEGDVVIWQGTDPTSVNTFSVHGSWYVGPVPTSGRFFTNVGGDVIVLSVMGLVPLSKLISGSWNDPQDGPTSKIQNQIQPLVQEQRTTVSWDVFMVPKQNLLIIRPPQASTGEYVQFALNVNTNAWCTFSNIPMTCATTLGDITYCGTSDGRVFKVFVGNLDAVESNGTGGTNVEGDIQTAFAALGSSAQLKKFNLAHPIFVAPQSPSVKLQMNTQFTFQGVPGSPSFTSSSGSTWSSGVWNVARWVGGTNTYQAWVGVTGLGYYGSIRMKVRGVAGTLFTGSQLMYELGGVL